MEFRLYMTAILSIFIMSGCSNNTNTDGILSYQSEISTSEINDALSKVFPVKKKTAAGTIGLKRAMLSPAVEGNKVRLSVGFSLSSFAIPEGVDGIITMSSGLRYDQSSKKLFLTNVTPVNTTFANDTIIKYVSKAARTALGVVAKRELNDIEIYQLDSTFTARFIKYISVKGGKIIVHYGI